MKAGQSSVRKKKLLSQERKPFEVLQVNKRFKKPQRLEQTGGFDRKLARVIDQTIKRDFRKQYKKHKKRGSKMILRVSITRNVNGKRYKHGISIRRARIRTIKQLEFQLDKLKTQIQAKTEKYLERKSCQSVSFKGIDMEIITKDTKNETLIKTPGLKRAKKKA